MFNEICINEEMLPKYTYFKLIHIYTYINPNKNTTKLTLSLGFNVPFRKIVDSEDLFLFF